MSSTETVLLESENVRLQIDSNGKVTFTRGDAAWHAPVIAVLHYYDRQHPRPETVTLPTSDSTAFGTPGTLSFSAEGNFDAERIDDRTVRIKARFPAIQITFPITFRLDPDDAGFQVTVDSGGIGEDYSRLYRMLSLEILPNFGAARTGEEGYLVLPNWCGAQMFFDHKVSRELRQIVYSSNDQWEYNCNMPFFGIHRSFGTMSGLLTAGEMDARLVCRQHYERDRVNCVHPEFVFRWEQQDDLMSGRREIRYSFAPVRPDKEGYVHVARNYRDWLTAESNLKTWDEKAQSRPEAVDYRDRFFLKFFMAYKEPHPEGRGTYHATCTFEEVREILEDLLARGVHRICAILVGWNIDGHDGMPPTRFPVDERLGGEAAMRDLIEWCRENDIMLGVHDSYGASYSCSPEHNTDDLIRHRTGEYWESVIWSGGRSHKICPSVYVEKHVRRTIPRIADLGVHGHHHIDAVGSFMPCFSEDHPLPRRSGTIRCNRRMFGIATEVMGSVSTEMPFGSYFDVIDGVYHSFTTLFSFHAACRAAAFCDRLVPISAIVLHGSVKLMRGVGGETDGGTHMAAFGLSPQWEVSKRPAPHFGITTYDEAKDKLISFYHTFYGEQGLSLLLEDKRLKSVHEPAEGVRCLRYEGGYEVIANESEHEFDGLAPGTFELRRPD